MAERRQGIYFVSDLAEIEQGINTHNNDWRLLWVDEIIDGLNERFRALSTTCSYLTPAVVLRLVRIKTGESRPCLIGWGGVPQSFQRNGRVEKHLLYETVQRCRILEIGVGGVVQREGVAEKPGVRGERLVDDRESETSEIYDCEHRGCSGVPLAERMDLP